MKRFVLTDEGGNIVREVAEAYLDGYAIGDRQLEDVWFKVTIVNNDFKVEAQPGDMPYLRTLNLKRWLREARKCCGVGPDYEFYSEPGNEPDVICEDPDEPQKAKRTPQPITVVATMRPLVATMRPLDGLLP